jgi:hypothetical protein
MLKKLVDVVIHQSGSPSAQLFHQVAHEGQETQMACTLNGGGHATLVFQAVAGNTAGQQFTLFVDELNEEVRVFVVDIFDTKLAETAVFFAIQPDFRVAEEFYIFA